MLLKLCERIENILDGRQTFARFGGDEFVIAFSNIINDKEINEFLDELLLKVRKPFDVNNKKIYCTISIGVSVYSKDSNRLVLKIDKSFVDGIGVDEKSEYIAESIIKLSHSLNLKVVAEGVETKEQLGYLNKMKCDVEQGYYFSKPEKFEVIKEMI